MCRLSREKCGSHLCGFIGGRRRQYPPSPAVIAMPDDDVSGDDDRLEPQSIDGLSPEEALRGFMEVDPEKVKEQLAEKGCRRRNR